MNKIRTLGFYQPFGSLMLYDKIETRWVRENKKPPFPLGKYLFYTTKKPCDEKTMLEWCGPKMYKEILELMEGERTWPLNGYAIGIGDLIKIKPLEIEEESKAFVKFAGIKTEVSINKVQWGLHFENVQGIEPFEWKYGKQGIGFVPESEIDKIKIV